jgi:hypothetical protein
MFGDNLHVTFNGEWRMENGELDNTENISQFSILNSQFYEIQPSVEDCFIAFNLNSKSN